MARTKSAGNGRIDRLEEAQAALVQAQAILVQAQATLAHNQTAFLARMAESDARMAETDRISSERFARIEAILMDHSRILKALPDAIRDKIGFKSPKPQRRSDGLPLAPSPWTTRNRVGEAGGMAGLRRWSSWNEPPPSPP